MRHPGQRPVPVVDLELGGLLPDEPLHQRTVHQGNEQPVAYRSGDRALSEDQAGHRAGGLEDLGGNRPALGLVAVQKRLVRPAGCHQGQLPGQILRVAEAGVHPLAPQGGVDVGGVAGKQHPAPSVGLCQPALDLEGGRPLGAPHHRGGIPGPLTEQVDDQGQELLGRRFVGAVGCSGGHQPPEAGTGKWEGSHHILSAQPHRYRVVGQRQVGMDVGEQKPLDDGDTGKADAGELADLAVGAVAAHQPAGSEALVARQPHADPAAVLLGVQHFPPPFHPSAEFAEPAAQLRLDLGLRDQQPGPGNQPGRAPNREAGGLPPVDVHRDLCNGNRALRQVAEGGEPIEHLHATGLQPQGARGDRWPISLVHHPSRYAGGEQAAGQRKACRPRTRDHHVTCAHR